MELLALLDSSPWPPRHLCPWVRPRAAVCLAMQVARSPAPAHSRQQQRPGDARWCCEQGVPWPFPCLEKHLVRIVSS